MDASLIVWTPTILSNVPKVITVMPRAGLGLARSKTSTMASGYYSLLWCSFNHRALFQRIGGLGSKSPLVMPSFYEAQSIAVMTNAIRPNNSTTSTTVSQLCTHLATHKMKWKQIQMHYFLKNEKGKWRYTNRNARKRGGGCGLTLGNCQIQESRRWSEKGFCKHRDVWAKRYLSFYRKRKIRRTKLLVPRMVENLDSENYSKSRKWENCKMAFNLKQFNTKIELKWIPQSHAYGIESGKTEDC